jgi:hypothetical protein
MSGIWIFKSEPGIRQGLLEPIDCHPWFELPELNLIGDPLRSWFAFQLDDDGSCLWSDRITVQN